MILKKILFAIMLLMIYSLFQRTFAAPIEIDLTTKDSVLKDSIVKSPSVELELLAGSVGYSAFYWLGVATEPDHGVPIFGLWAFAPATCGLGIGLAGKWSAHEQYSLFTGAISGSYIGFFVGSVLTVNLISSVRRNTDLGLYLISQACTVAFGLIGYAWDRSRRLEYPESNDQTNHIHFWAAPSSVNHISAGCSYVW